MTENMLSMRVRGVTLTVPDEQPVVVLESERGSVAVRVGAYEAGAIIMQLEELSTPRPLTHQLLAELLSERGIRVTRAEIYGVYGRDEDGFLARIVYGKGLRKRARDVRPSDAIALALAFKAPLLAHESLVRDDLMPGLVQEAQARAYWRPAGAAV